VVLNGGALNNFRTSGTAGITVTNLSVTANGGILGAEDDPSRFGIGTLHGAAGSTIQVQRRNNGAPLIATVSDARVVMQGGADYSNFLGTFVVQSDTSTSGWGFLSFEQDIATASFALEVQTGGTYTLLNDVSVTAATLGATSLGAGTYDYAALAGLGLAAFVENQGGTLTVDAGGGGGGYATWASANLGPGQPEDGDHNGDGVQNGIAYFMNDAGIITLPGVVGGTVTWTNGGNIPASAYGSEFVVETSPDLATWTPVDVGDLTSNTDGPGGTLTYTLPPGAPGGRIFARLKLTPN
jgi:hypothetical protein